MYYHGPKDFTPLKEHCKRFNSVFCYLEPDGTFVYDLDEEGQLPLDLSDTDDETLLSLIEKSAVEGKDLVYEAYKDKAFDPYPDPDAVY